MPLRRDIPLFQLEAEDGALRGTREAWQRREMLVALLHANCDGCQALHRELQARAPGWRRDEVELISVMMPGRPGEPLLPGALRDDPEGTVAWRLAEVSGRVPGTATLSVANRFGEFYGVVDVHGRSTSEVLAEALAWVDLAQRQCGECSAPLWE
ncbi:MAG TPA: hypothetical protein VF794_09320 [Archangium sp.]|jgi:hypothetical protein|uniref:hypothetical protein n=1 Tax=Archangium sp. TaxID=1872627 RepID=UPI002EDA7FE8